MKAELTQAANTGGFLPAFIRFPKVGERDPVCGLSRSALLKVVRELKVRTVSLKMPRSSKVAKKLKGNDPVRGSLIDVADLISKIRAQGGVS